MNNLTAGIVNGQYNFFGKKETLIKDIETDYEFQQLSGELDLKTAQSMMYLIRHVDDPGLAGMSHRDIHEYFESMSDPAPGHESAVFIAKEKSLGRVVGFAGVRVVESNTEKKGVVTDILTGRDIERAADIGGELINQVLDWSSKHQADEVDLSRARIVDGQALQKVTLAQPLNTTLDRP